ncbi:MAG: DUF4838 domain-containing protein [Planctomycetes bacterium]|nr:DUF4838 domain-containing protein [Planctomycetota bacterium]
MNTRIVAAVAMMLWASACVRAAVFVKDGKPATRIYVNVLTDDPAAPPAAGKAKSKKQKAGDGAALSAAARDLAHHLKKMSGVEVEIVVAEKAGEIVGPAIVLGDLANAMGATPAKTTPSKEAFRIVIKGDRVLIGGESDAAVVFGVYELLNRLGCDWVMPGEIGEVIPSHKTVEVGDLDVTQAPAFQMRRLWYRGYPDRKSDESSRMDRWLTRQRGGAYSPVAGGTAGHMWEAFVRKHAAEFEKDPTMYALVRDVRDGQLKRRGPQIETTHPRVLELMVADIKEALEKNNWPRNQGVAFPIGPADGLGYSVSSESQLVSAGRTDPIVGEADQTDTLINLGNRILETLGPDYPNVMVGFYSYSVHADYPSRYKPNPRIVQIFAPINFSRFHSVLAPNSKTQGYYRGVVEAWGRLSAAQGNPLIYRGYNWNLADNMLPYSKIRIWGEEIPWYAKQGVIAFNTEATKQWGVLAPSNYIYMRLCWDPSRDWKALLHEYCEKAYGKGGPAMERYWLALTERQTEAGQEAGSYFAFPVMYDDAFVSEQRGNLKKAEQKAEGEAEKTRVRYAAHGFEFLPLYLEYFRAAGRMDFVAAKAGLDALLAHWRLGYEMNPDIVANECPQYLARFLQSFVDEGLARSTGAYKKVYTIPDELPTMFDPLTVGHELRYQSPAINDANFVRTKTWSMPWDALGLTGMRSGAVWYRIHFDLSGDLKGKPIGLFLGGMEDEARVWVNGKFVGTSGVRFSLPAVFDLTDDVKAGAPNLIAVQVVRNGNANEIGLGGLLRPSFIFTGPRLPQKAPQQMEHRRVLPGGELGPIEE